MRPGGRGGVSARRAVVRWAWRLFRREWRQQALVLGLLTVAVAAATVAVSASYNLAPLPEARFGTAAHLLRYDGADPATLDARVAAARDWFGTVDVVGQRFVPIPGSVEAVELRSQDPGGAHSAPMLRLRSGDYPTDAGEVAVTDAVATTFRLGVGGRLSLEGRTWTVTGLVENPSDLGAEFVLVPPAYADQPESVTILAAATEARFAAFREAHGSPPVFESRATDERTVAAAGVFGLVTVGMLLVCLVAAAGFAVLAQRRLRQLGLFAAIGATERQLRLVLVASGTFVGVAAATLGTTAGLLLWIAAAPRLETAAAHRIDRLALPWWLIAATMLLAIGMATGAAWRPARATARIPITLALSARPPIPRSGRNSAVLASLLTVIGVGCLALSRQDNPALIIAGTLATTLGLLFASPLAIRVLAAVGARAPIGPRLALRDLARYQARSGAALAAISLALAIPVAIVITASAAEHGADEGNLSDRQLLVRVGAQFDPLIPAHTPDELASLEAQVRRFAATVGEPTVIPLDMAVDPAARPEQGFDGSKGGRPAAELGIPTGGNQFRSIPLYVATPDVLRYYGRAPGTIGPDVDILTTHTAPDLQIVGVKKRDPSPRTTGLDGPAYSSQPNSLLSPAVLERNGWAPARAGWLIEADRPLTDAQLGGARDMAVAAGLTVESRQDQGGLLVLRWSATAAGGLLALGVLALTVGLIRAEAAGDLRTLRAAGATGRTRRALTATTAGGLALLGAILGIAAAYLGLAAAYADDLGTLGRVPVVELALTAVVVPLIATAAGWLLAARDRGSLTRLQLE